MSELDRLEISGQSRFGVNFAGLQMTPKDTERDKMFRGSILKSSQKLLSYRNIEEKQPTSGKGSNRTYLKNPNL